MYRDGGEPWRALRRLYYARNFMKYLLAREVDPVERGASSSLGEGSLTTGSMRELLLQLVALDTFRSRVSDPL